MNFRSVNVRPIDIVAVCLAVALTVMAAISAYGGSAVASHVRVETKDGTHVYDLSLDLTLAFDGPLGDTVVEISDGQVRVISSPCREQICVNSGVLATGGDWTACLPNRVFLEVTGDDDPDVDAVSF